MPAGKKQGLREAGRTSALGTATIIVNEMWWARGYSKGERVENTVTAVAAVIRRAKASDREAFGELYRLTVKPVYRYLSARLSGQADAEELTQEVFLAALAGLPNLRAEDEVGLLAWLLQIARYKLADRLRGRYRRPSTPLEEVAEVQDDSNLPGDLALASEERAELRAALERLTPEQREVVIAKYVLGYDNERTARLVGKNTNAVNQLHHRALASLHRLLTSTERAGQ